MNGGGRLLIIDDDNLFLETYEDLLSAWGYKVESATTRTKALERLDEPGWSVVLVDQKLDGPGGGDDGLDLIAEVGIRAPGAKAILVTAYASNEAVERAFKDGAYDYLEKRSVFAALLRVKVRNAMEAVRERWLGALDQGETEKAIRATWEAVQAEKDRNRKGLLLEQLMELLLKTIPGFQRLRARMKNELEELDILVQNNAPDPLWQKESPYILVECKNWSSHVGTKDVRDLLGKLEGRYKRCRVALFVAAGGFADTVRLELRSRAREENLVLLLGPGDLETLVNCSDRSAVLKEIHQRAVAATFDHGRDE
ncbi:response regulator [Polyangium jinanense]|uniref:Response regulator n=1 Tax=Polyangium jinanense TaxID=2829994 RepID=A0A9X4AXI3_9BACT|nr:response regulator [Polyangium jinanense]MDC3961208.1 response regulator [Polyangium jinanense]MDC3988598.1 response regulator [Polyangium jinanense]